MAPGPTNSKNYIVGISLNFDNYYDRNAIKEEQWVKMIELLINCLGGSVTIKKIELYKSILK